jgi:DNA-binding CsgD family transcriptional regulator
MMASSASRISGSGESSAPFVGRAAELAALGERIERAVAGAGRLVLLSGEAGSGKTALAEAAVALHRIRAMFGAAAPHASAPYAPLVSILREHERAKPGFLASSGPLASHLAVLLPELGPAPASSDRASLDQALCDGLVSIARSGAAMVVLEDLQWGDEATLELLPRLATVASDCALVVIASYRSDEISRGHGLRRVRAELRRTRCLDEMIVPPLSQSETAELTSLIVGAAAAPDLLRRLHEKTGGIPFFVEEIARTLGSSRRFREGAGGFELPGEVPLPETIRDAVRLRTDRLSPSARAALEIASIAGVVIEPWLIQEDVASGLDEAIELGFLREEGDGTGSFRHALVRESVYADVPWTRRRNHHRRIAERLESCGAGPERIASHWLAARELERARPRLLEAAAAFCAMHAYRDAARVGRQALDIWPEGKDESDRIIALERFGHCAELSGDMAEASRAWEEVRDAHRAAKNHESLGEIARRLATAYDIQGMPERTRAAREEAAAAFESCGRNIDAINERMAIAERLELAGGGTAALRMLTALAQEIERTGSAELRIRAMALEGEFRAKLGEREAGIQLAREALGLALEHGAPGPAAEAYYRLGAALENACDHDGAVEAYTTARGFCLGQKIEGLAQICFACMLPAVLLTGQWSRTIEISRTVLRSPHSPDVARMKAKLHLGLIEAMRGNGERARRLLEETYEFSQRAELVPIEVFSVWGLARVLELRGDGEAAAERCGELVRRASRRDERHYSVPPLRWASTLFARRGQARQVGACADILSGIAAASGHPECVAPMAHALGELAMVNGDSHRASEQFQKALELFGEAGLPYERAETQMRAAAALSACGRRGEAVEMLSAANRTARKLGAKPLALQAAAELKALGESLESHLGRRGAAYASAGGLSPRELDVLRLVADGLTNRQVADRLFISRRTVDMHMRNVLARLGCRSRVEAAGRARDLRLLG